MIGDTFLGSLKAYLGLDISQYEREINQAEKDLLRFERAASNAGRQLAQVGRQLTLTVTAPIAAVGAVSTKAFAAFDKAVTESLAIMGNVAGDTRREMESLALTLSTQSTQAAKELGAAYFFLASAGYSAQASLEALPVVSRFAQAGAFNLSQATSMLADSVVAMGMASKDTALNTEAMARASDVLIKANTLANASVSQFAAALTNKAATALRILNKDIEEGVAVLAAYANVGIKAEVAGQNLSMAYRDLQRAVLKAPDAWKELGIQVFDSAGEMRHMADIIGDMEIALDGMSDKAKRASISQLKLQERSMMALLALVGMSDEIRRFDSELRQAGGTTDEVAGKQMLAFANQMKAVWHEIQNAGIALGRVLAPAVLKVSKAIGALATWLGDSSDAMKIVVIGASVLAAALGPILLIVGTLVSSTLALSASMTALQMSMAGLASTGVGVTGIGPALMSLSVAGVATAAAWAAAAVAVAYVAFNVGKLMSQDFMDWWDDIDRSAAVAGDTIDRFTNKNKDFQKSAGAYRIASQEVQRLTKALQELEDITGLKGQQTNLKLMKQQANALAARNQMLKKMIAAQRELGQFNNMQQMEKQMRRNNTQWSILVARISAASKVVAVLTEKQRRLNQLRERQMIHEKNMAAIQETSEEARLKALQETNSLEHERLTIKKEFKEAMDKIDEQEAADKAEQNVTDPRVYDEARKVVQQAAQARLRILEKTRKDELALELAHGLAKKQLELNQAEDELIKLAETEKEKERIRSEFGRRRRLLETERTNELSMASEDAESRRLLALKLEFKELSKIVKTEEERLALSKAYGKQRMDLLAAMLRTEVGKVQVNQPSRLTGEQVGTVEAFRSEKGIDDDTMKYQEENLKLQEAQEKLLSKLSSQGVTIKDLKIASMRGR